MLEHEQEANEKEQLKRKGQVVVYGDNIQVLYLPYSNGIVKAPSMHPITIVIFATKFEDKYF